MKLIPSLSILLAGMLLSCQSAHLSHASSKNEKSEVPGQHSTNRSEGDVKSHAEKEAGPHRKKILEEAESALAETKKALRALEAKKSEEALAALERVSGKLNIVLARDPQLALAPIDVAVTVHDIDTTAEAIKNTRQEAEALVGKGDLQKARLLLRGFASEIVTTEISIPLKTYPQAIATVAPLIDQGKLDEAKAAIEAALNTLVVTEHIVPLPVVRAEAHLTKAEALAKKDARSEEENKQLATLLSDARAQLTLAENLGYGRKQDYKAFYAELTDIEDKTKAGNSGSFFGKVKARLSDLKHTVFD